MRKLFFNQVKILAGLLVFFLFSATSQSVYAQTPYVPNQVLVEYQDGSAPQQVQQVINNQSQNSTQSAFQETSLESAYKIQSQINSLNQKIGALSVTPLSSNSKWQTHYVVTLKQGSDINQAIQDLKQQSSIIKAVQPNYYMHSFSVTPNDPYYSSLQWNLQKIDMPDAWGITEGSTNVTVAVIDSGIDYNNPDFAGTNIIKGKNFITGTMDPMDDFGHGTHVAGIIAASSNNNLGISGIDWKVKLLAIKVIDSSGQGSTSNVIAGIQQAVADGANIINLSLGEGSDASPNPCSSDQVLQDTINTAAQAGILVIAAAGNGTYNQQTNQVVLSNSANVSPASCNNVLTVGATSKTDSRASYSDYGSNVVISAPGGDISSTLNAADGILSLKASQCSPTGEVCPANLVYKTNYLFSQGTSMAAPHVAGVAALLLANNPSLSIQQIRNCLVNNADPVNTSSQYPIGPRVNAYKALQACSPSPSSGLSPTITPIPTVSIKSTDAYINLKILLDGIGSAGDNANPNSYNFSNKNPVTNTRDLKVTVLQGQTIINTTTCLVHYDSISGTFTTSPQAPCDMGNIATGNYEIKVKTDRYLQKIASNDLNITDGQASTLPIVNLIAGDINGDNVIDLQDYNLLLNCYSDFTNSKCSGSNLTSADLNDDGKVNYADLNLFLREPHVAGQ